MKADLHLHSVYSDGLYSPEELVNRACSLGMGVISLTDHDNMEGCEEAALAAEKAGSKLIRGMEISAYDGDCKVHTLGYGCARNAAYAAFLKRQIEGSRVRVQEMLEKANKLLSFHVTMEGVEREHEKTNTPIHSSHAVRVYAKLLNKGVGELYRELFNVGCVAYSGACRPTPQEAIDLIHACGGKAVLAHPGRITLDTDGKLSLLKTLCDGGLDGIECRYPTHTVGETEFYLSYAREHGLLATGGSDFHAVGGREIGVPYFDAEEQLLSMLDSTFSG